MSDTSRTRSDHLPESPAPGRRLEWLRAVGLAGSGGLLAVLCVGHWLQPDAAAFYTIWPFWGWLPLGLWVLLIGHGPHHKRAWRALLVAWLAATGLCSDEVPGLLRRRAEPQQAFRVVTLNCAGGDPAAAREALASAPDVTLFQESPVRSELAPVVVAAYGRGDHLVAGLDASVAARGEVRPVPPLTSHFSETRVTLPDGREIAVISLRLLPVPVSLKFWSATCRNALNEHRRAQRREMAAVLERVRRLPPDLPFIVGGDFNAPAGDAACELLQPFATDAWRVAGVGWGDTIINDIPMSRIDQLWFSRHWRALRVRAVRSAVSDHRMVTAEMALPGRR